MGGYFETVQSEVIPRTLGLGLVIGRAIDALSIFHTTGSFTDDDKGALEKTAAMIRPQDSTPNIGLGEQVHYAKFTKLAIEAFNLSMPETKQCLENLADSIGAMLVEPLLGDDLERVIDKLEVLESVLLASGAGTTDSISL